MRGFNTAPKYIALIFLALAFFVSACTTTAGKTQGSVPLYVGDAANAQYMTMWKASLEVVPKYFSIQKKDRKKGVIVTKPRVESDAAGKETKRAFVTIKQTTDGYDVKVEVPYLKYDRYKNIYKDKMRDGKRILIVEREKVKAPSNSDIYLEALIRSEILRSAKKSS